MLRNTFIHVPGIGLKTEAALWSRGIATWEDYLNSHSSRAGIRLPHSRVPEYLLRSEEALERRDASFFGRGLPHAGLWRMFDEFKSSTIFLDIETTGLSPLYHQLTVVGCYDGREYRPYIAGRDLAELHEALANASMLVTFNGTQFDVPFLLRKMPGLKLPPVHLDLRFLLRRVELVGGLKQIETDLGLKREAGGAADGREAVDLWYRYQRGDSDALRRLIRYNHDDTVVLEYMADHATSLLRQRLGPLLSPPAETVGPAPDAPYSYMEHRADLEGLLDRLAGEPACPAPSRGRSSIDGLLASAPDKARHPRIVGLDPTASDSRASGWAFLHGRSVVTTRLRTDAEIVDATLESSPDIVCIDSPLSLPAGTRLGEDGTVQSFDRIHRDSELVLRRRGVPLFWCLLPSMQRLTLRGIGLAQSLRSHGLTVIETYPGGAQDILGMPRKGKSIRGLASALADFGISGDYETHLPSHDELDAITAALVGLFYLCGRYEALGEPEMDDLILPSYTVRGSG